jgi:hypothetical protein
MAITFTDRAATVNAGGTEVQTLTSASFTPASNCLLVVAAYAVNFFFATEPDMALSNTGGLTFTRIEQPAAAAFGPGGGDTRSTIAVWTAPVATSPGAMTVTVDPWTTTQLGDMHILVVECLGAEAVTVRQSDSVSDELTGGSSETLTTPTLAALGTGTVGLCFFGTATDGGPPVAPSTPAGWTALSGTVQLPIALSSFTKAAAATSATSADLGTVVYAACAAILELEEGGGEPEPATLAMYVGELPVVALYVGEASA